MRAEISDGSREGLPGLVKTAGLPRREDVATIDGLIRAFYEVVSGPRGAPRDWARAESLLLSGARFACSPVAGTRVGYASLDHAAYVQRVEPFFAATGFFESEIHRVVHEFGRMTHVFSTYEARHEPSGPVVVRGVNSIDIVRDADRFWIASAAWDSETDENPIPAWLLP